MGTFTLRADFNSLDGGASTTEAVTISANTQIADNGVIYDGGTDFSVGGSGVLRVLLPATDLAPHDFGFIVRRDNGLVRNWRVPAQPPGTTVELTDFTATTPIPLPATGDAVSQVQLGAALDAKADLDGGTVPDAQLPDRLSADGLTASFVGRDELADLADPDDVAGALAGSAVSAAIAAASLGYVVTEAATASHSTVAGTEYGPPNYGSPPKFGAAAIGYGSLGVPNSVPEADAAHLTVELWVRLEADSDSGIFVLWSLGDLWLGLTGQPRTPRLNGPAAQVNSATTLSNSAYHHLAVQTTRTGGQTALHSWFLDGAPLSETGSPGTVAWTDDFVAGALAGGNFSVSAHARVDEFRVSDIHRYSGAFTPPTTAFTQDADTLVLVHAENANAVVRTGTGLAYPARPDAPAGAVTYVGTTEPSDGLTGDEWRQIA